MATMVGKESTLSERLSNLIELDYDAINAYREAIERVDDAESKQELAKFMADHERHTEELSAHLKSMGETPPTEGDAKSMLTKGKVMLADLAGDKALLKAMKTNEDDTNTAYERAVEHDDTPAELKAILERNLADERRHREWIEARSAAL
jgi:uncharacterized protein (TIGR02284 family)